MISHSFLRPLIVLLAFSFVAPGRAEFSGPQTNFAVATNAALAAAPTTAYPNGVWRNDYSAGYGAPPTFYTPSSSACSLNSGAGDGGSQVPSADGKCWIANIPNGEASVMMWPGMTDIGIGNATGTDSTAALNAAFTWCASQNNGKLKIGAHRFAATSANLNVQSGCTVEFNPHTGWRYDGSTYLTTIVNTNSAIVLSGSYTLNLSGVLKDPAIFQYGLTPIASTQDGYTKIYGLGATASSFVGTAITIAAPDARIEHPLVIGFNTCIADTNEERPGIYSARIDCINGLNFNNVQDVAHVMDLVAYPFFGNSLESTPYVNVILNVTGVSNNGSGLIRLTTTSSTASFTAGEQLQVRGVGGFSGANGLWTISAVGSNYIDLTGSSYTGFTATATWASGETMLTLSSLSGVYYGMNITGTGIPASTTVRTIDWRNNQVWISNPTTAAGAGATVTLSSNAYTSGGQANLNLNYRPGTVVSLNGSTGAPEFEMHFTDLFEFGWLTGFSVNGANDGLVMIEQMSCGDLWWPQAVCLSLQGAATGVTWNGGEAGGLAAVLFDDTTAAGSSNSINNVLIRPNTASDPSLVLVSLTGAGTRQLSGLYSLGSGYGVGSILQYGTAGQTKIDGNMPNLDVYPQNVGAEQSLSFGSNTILNSASPYQFNLEASWTPTLKLGGNSTGITYAKQFGRYSIQYPWITLGGQIALSSNGSATGAATIAGGPVQCDTAYNNVPEMGGSYVYNTGMSGVSGGVFTTGSSASNLIDLWTQGATGATALADTNFTSSSDLGFQVTCHIRYVQR